MDDASNDEKVYMKEDSPPFPDQSPSEVLQRFGVENLSNQDLLSLLFNCGSINKPEMNNIITLISNEKDPMKDNIVNLYKTFNKDRLHKIIALKEIAKRFFIPQTNIINKPSDIFDRIKHFGNKKQEYFITISLNTSHQIISIRVVTIGIVNRTIIHPREIFSDILIDRATAFCIAHNHPSGSPNPSPEDDDITKRVKDSSEILGIHLLDHIIFTPESFYSYKNACKL